MRKFELRQVTGPEPLARAAAGDWLKATAAALPQPVFCAALSGGRIAKTLFAALAARAYAAPLKSVPFFWSDERCVPPTPEKKRRCASRRRPTGALPWRGWSTHVPAPGFLPIARFDRSGRAAKSDRGEAGERPGRGGRRVKKLLKRKYFLNKKHRCCIY